MAIEKISTIYTDGTTIINASLLNELKNKINAIIDNMDTDMLMATNLVYYTPFGGNPNYRMAFCFIVKDKTNFTLKVTDAFNDSGSTRGFIHMYDASTVRQICNSLSHNIESPSTNAEWNAISKTVHYNSGYFGKSAGTHSGSVTNANVPATATGEIGLVFILEDTSDTSRKLSLTEIKATFSVDEEKNIERYK